MKLKISLGAIFTITAAILTYVSNQINGIYVGNSHGVYFRLNPCNVADDFVMMELEVLTAVATLLFLLFLYLFYQYNNRCGKFGHAMSTVMLIILLMLSVAAVDLRLTGITVL